MGFCPWEQLLLLLLKEDKYLGGQAFNLTIPAQFLSHFPQKHTSSLLLGKSYFRG